MRIEELEKKKKQLIDQEKYEDLISIRDQIKNFENEKLSIEEIKNFVCSNEIEEDEREISFKILLKLSNNIDHVK